MTSHPFPKQQTVQLPHPRVLSKDAIVLFGEVLEVMSQNGMETLGVQRCDEYPTGRVQVHIKDGEHQFEILSSQAYDFIDQAAANEVVTSIHPLLVYFGTLAQRHEVSRQALISVLGDIQAAKFLDINLRTR